MIAGVVVVKYTGNFACVRFYILQENQILYTKSKSMCYSSYAVCLKVAFTQIKSPTNKYAFLPPQMKNITREIIREIVVLYMASSSSEEDIGDPM